MVVAVDVPNGSEVDLALASRNPGTSYRAGRNGEAARQIAGGAVRLANLTSLIMLAAIAVRIRCCDEMTAVRVRGREQRMALSAWMEHGRHHEREGKQRCYLASPSENAAGPALTV
jgi:hypothetical protein